MVLANFGNIVRKLLIILFILPLFVQGQNLTRIVGRDSDSNRVFQKYADGGLQVTTAETQFNLDVAMGTITGHSIVEKFGENPDIDTGTDPEDIWSFGGIYTYSTTDDIDRLSSSSASDTEDITVVGLDTNWAEVTQVITLTGQTPVALTTDLIRVYRMYNSNGTDLVGTVYCFVDGATSSGVPNTAADVRAVITIGSGQTEMCIYTIPAGKTGYFYGGYVSLSRTGNNGAVFTSRIRAFGGVFKVVSRIACVATGNSSWQYKYPFPVAIPEKTDMLLRCDEVDANGTGVSGGFTILLVDN